MKTVVFIFSALLLVVLKSYSQDTIFTNTGRTIVCEISKEDSVSIYFSTTVNDQSVTTSIKKESVKKISYNKLLKEQNWDTDSIIIIKKKSSNEYYYHRQKLSTKELNTLLCKRYSPREMVDDSKAHHAVAMALAFGGGYLVGYPLGSAFRGETPNWGMAGAGAVCLLVGYLLEQKSQLTIKKAIDAYNKEIAKEKANTNSDTAVQKE